MFNKSTDSQMQARDVTSKNNEKSLRASMITEQV